MILNFAIIFSISEYLILKGTNFNAINYQKENTILNLPYWLIFGAYPSMVLNFLLIQDFLNFNNNDESNLNL